MRPHDRSPAPLVPGNDESRGTPGGSWPATLARRVASTIGSSLLADILARNAGDAADFEASVRGGSGEPLRGGRMMIERASMEILAAIASTLDVPLPPSVPQWLDVARQYGLPIIAGWDVRTGGTDRCVKLYVNASDAAAAVRARLCEALLARDDASPAVVGMNVRADGAVETKVYLQSADAVALAADLEGRAQALAAAARADGADAGGVLSVDAGASLQPRAFFVALREPAGPAGWPCVRSLPGYDIAAIGSLLPFPPAPPRSVGVALGGRAWTLYFKPRSSGRAPDALEPTAIFRDGSVEIGVFVEPTEHAARAFRRTERHAVSVRVRAGTPTPAALESLVDWFAGRVRAVERTQTDLRLRVSDPPAPWHLVARRGAGELA